MPSYTSYILHGLILLIEYVTAEFSKEKKLRLEQNTEVGTFLGSSVTVIARSACAHAIITFDPE